MSLIQESQKLKVSILVAFVSILALAACGTQSLNSVRPGGARVMNNGTNVVNFVPYRGIVAIDIVFGPGPEDKGFCSGALVNPRQVLTAGHCVVEEEILKALSPAQISVEIEGRRYSVIANDIKPQYLLGKSEADDLAVLTLTEVAPATAKPFPLAKSRAKMMDLVTIIGFGVATSDDDIDKDFVRNDLDNCPMTPEYLTSKVALFGPRAGCEASETLVGRPDITPRSSYEEAGELRMGTNTVTSAGFSGVIRIQGPFTTVAEEGKVTPAFGDSGAPLLNAAQEIIGTVSGGFILPLGQIIVHESIFADVLEETNQKFLEKILKPVPLQ